MKKTLTKRIISVLLAVCICTVSLPIALASDDENNAQTVISNLIESVQTVDGVETSIVSFLENGIPSEVKTERYPSGQFVVTVTVDGNESVQETMLSQSPIVDFNLAPRITYPHYEPYWYARTDSFSVQGQNLTVSILAGALAKALGMNAKDAVSLGTKLFGVLTVARGDNIYFEVDRYYAYLAQSVNGPVTWYNKFVTDAWYHPNHDGHASGYPITEIYESAEPM